MNIYFLCMVNLDIIQIVLTKKLNKRLDAYRSDHLVCFERLVCSRGVSNEDIDQMINFYDELLKVVDKALGKKYLFKYVINKNDVASIDHFLDKLRTIGCCARNRIIIFIPCKIFNNELIIKLKYVEYNNIFYGLWIS